MKIQELWEQYAHHSGSASLTGKILAAATIFLGLPDIGVGYYGLELAQYLYLTLFFRGKAELVQRKKTSGAYTNKVMIVPELLFLAKFVLLGIGLFLL